MLGPQPFEAPFELTLMHRGEFKLSQNTLQLWLNVHWLSHWLSNILVLHFNQGRSVDGEDNYLLQR